MQQIIISLISGALGGNAAGAILKKFSLGPIWNSVVGILGGGLGGQILSMITGGNSSSGAGIVGNILSSGVGGGILMTIVGLIRGQMANKT
ncbi:MAG TPA: hypothetical protein VMI12_13615 [Puia sp.]|nr:hypothetical protein [Puia sp.]